MKSSAGPMTAGLAAGAAIAALAMGLLVAASPAQAQAPGCEKIKDLLTQRKAIVDRIQSLGKGGKKMDAQQACGVFGNLVNNGAQTIKWLESNRAWCQIPDNFIGGIRADNQKAATIRGQACKVAAQQAEMQRRARAGGGAPGGDGGPLGGPGLTGQMKIPQGAL